MHYVHSALETSKQCILLRKASNSIPLAWSTFHANSDKTYQSKLVNDFSVSFNHLFYLRLRNEFQPFSTKNQAASDSLPYTAFFHVLRRSDALFDKSKIWQSRSIHVISKFCKIEASRRRTLHP